MDKAVLTGGPRLFPHQMPWPLLTHTAARGELPCVLSVSQISSYSMGEELTQIRSQEAKVVGATLEAAHHRR